MACPMCDAACAPSYNAVDENCRISRERFTYVTCMACGTVCLPDPPADLGRYYGAEYYAIPTLAGLDAIAAKDPSKINIVKRFKDNGRLLEVGPAFGVFARQAQQAGFDVDVIEMDEACCTYLQDTVGVRVTRSDHPEQALPGLPAHDVIALWHVFEHLPDPLTFLKVAAANLNPGGILVLGMPNPQAWQFKVMGKHWPHLDAPRHLTLIPQAILTRTAQGLGLQCEHFTTDDSDARSWNAFGWQRLLMNRFSSKFMERAMFVLGYGLTLLLSPLDRRPGKGSAYTVVFRKAVS